jgi:hypothetical protein
MKIDAKDPDAYVAAAPPERRPHLERLRALVKKSVPRATETTSWTSIRSRRCASSTRRA